MTLLPLFDYQSVVPAAASFRILQKSAWLFETLTIDSQARVAAGMLQAKLPSRFLPDEKQGPVRAVFKRTGTEGNLAALPRRKPDGPHP
jgi:hypothetical protein